MLDFQAVLVIWRAFIYKKIQICSLILLDLNFFGGNDNISYGSVNRSSLDIEANKTL